jgi:dihydrofolate synthase/folylpolyglutamate synthase
MSLAGMLERLYARRRFGIRPGVGRVRLMLDRLGNPERSFRTVHVVGTNGKGSTSAFLSSILTAAGYRTALFTSPHLVDFTERFRINGREISRDRLSESLDAVLAQAPDEATFFEIVTALAAFCFAGDSSEVAVMEAGMGGRSDATAALPGIMTVITPISQDHGEYLGDTLTGIADEKAGIIEPGTVVVAASQSPEVQARIQDRCIGTNSRLHLAGRDFSAAWNSGGTLDYNGINAALPGLSPGIPGRYQAENAALALAAAELLGNLGFPSSEATLAAGVGQACWPGRMELLKGEPPILLDGAHNPAGAAALAEALTAYRYRRLLLVAGVMGDKDARAIFAPLAALAYKAYAVTPAVERALDGVELSGILQEIGITAIACGSVANGIETARREAGEDDLILVCGSLFAVGEAKALLAGVHYEGIRG